MSNKYGARAIEEDGFTFASIAEHRRYRELRLLERAGRRSASVPGNQVHESRRIRRSRTGRERGDNQARKTDMVAALKEIKRLRVPVLGDDEEFRPDPALDAKAEDLMKRHRMPAGQYRVTVLWKRKGGKSAGSPVLGKCQLASGLVKYGMKCDAVIWLAADHLSEKDDRAIEATLFHELLHIDSDPDTFEIKLRNHDFAGFASELTTYGLYLPDLEAAAEAFEQARLL